MEVNKVTVKGQTVIDLTSDTITPEKLVKGVTAHDKSGSQITGTMEVANKSKFGVTIDFFIPDLDSEGKFINSSVGTQSNPLNLDFTGLKNINNSSLQSKFSGRNIYINSINFPDLENFNGGTLSYTFNYATINQETISFPKITQVTSDSCFNYTFNNCKGVKNIVFPSLTSVTGYRCFSDCCNNMYNLEKVSFPVLEIVAGDEPFYDFMEHTNSSTIVPVVEFTKLKQIGSSTINTYDEFAYFRSDTPHIELQFPELTTIYCTYSGSYGTFRNCSGVSKFYFPKLITISPRPNASGTFNAHKYIFVNCTNLTEIHFGAANQAAIEATDGYATKWAAPNANCTIYFDL